MSTVSNASRSPLHLRVFLASPGDVADERVLALRVLEELQYDPLLRGKITAETVAWGRPGAGTPMLATLTPQEAIKQDSCFPVLLAPYGGADFISQSPVYSCLQPPTTQDRP